MRVLGVIVATGLLFGCTTTPHFIGKQDGSTSQGTVVQKSTGITWGGVISNVKFDKLSDSYQVTIIKTVLSKSKKPFPTPHIANTNSFVTLVDREYGDKLVPGKLMTIVGETMNFDGKDSQVTTQEFYIWNRGPIYQYSKLEESFIDQRGNKVTGVWSCSECNNLLLSQKRDSFKANSIRKRFHENSRPKSYPPYEITIDTRDY